MKTKIVCAFLFTLLTGMVALSYAERLPVPSLRHSLPAGINGQAYEVAVSKDGIPVLYEVRTALPVLFYAGRSFEGKYQAYTTLALYDEFAPNGRRKLTAKEVAAMARPSLVPSGDLFVESDLERYRKVNSLHQYVVAAAWSPTDGNTLAYTFSSGSDYGVAVVDIRLNKVRVLRSRDVLPDRVAWSNLGDSVQFYSQIDDAKGSDSHGEEISRFELAQVQVSKSQADNLEWSSQLPRLEEAKTTSTFKPQAYEITLSDGTRFGGDDFLGRSQLRVLNPEGELAKPAVADVVIGVLPDGVVYKRMTPSGAAIEFIDRKGNISDLAATKSLVNYYLPFMPFFSPGITVTQSGSGYSPQCGVFDHTGAMAYAYDMQAVAGNESIESAASGTVAYLAKTVTCNSLDTAGCSDYSSACTGTASNSGWGNTIILQHADGTWTKYSHLRYGSVLPPSTGVSVDFGCELATEGHTGATVGNKNGCGDHLHFQRQVTAAIGGSSTSITFADQTVFPLRCTTYTSGNQGRSCLFR